jgi:hypothetical protein
MSFRCEKSLILIFLQKNGAPVWRHSAAKCEKHVLQWLVDNEIKPLAVDADVSVVMNWDCFEFDGYDDICAKFAG